MWQDATSYDNWRCHFVPVYTLSYNANSGTGAPANAYTATEGDATARTLKVSMTEPTRNGYSFQGWATSSGNASAGKVDYAPGASITLSADQELWAVWECVDPTITTDLSEDEVDYYVGASATALTVAATAAGGSVSYQWYSNDEKNTTTPTTLTTGASYTPSTAAAGTTYYYCVVTNSTVGCSTTTTSSIAKIVVSRQDPTTQTFSAASTSICSGSDATFTLAGSQVGATYYLTKASGGGSAIGDSKAGTGSALTFTATSATTGDYYCWTSQTTAFNAKKVSKSKVTISYKTATSVTVDDATLDDAVVDEEYTISGITGAGAGTLYYQWYSYSDDEGSDETAIVGADADTYAFTPDAEGNYYFKCKVTGDCGSVKSELITVTASPGCDDPSASLNNGAYTIGGSALDLRTLWSSSNTTDGVTFSVTNANGTGATIAGDGYSFSATTAGTATISASQTSTGDYCDVAATSATITVSNPTYTVTYTTTGSSSGTAPTDSNSPYESGSTVTVKGNTGSLVKTGYVFLGWSDGNSNNYAPGETFTISTNTTLSPIWKEGTSATITYTMAVGSGNTWSASGSSNETTGIPNAGVTITTTNAGIDSGKGADSGRTAKLAIKTGANGATYDSPTNYILYNFSVASGYAFTPSDITIQIANVDGSSANNIKYKAVLSDASSHSISTTYICTNGNGTVETFHLYNEEGVTFDGSVSLKLWAWTIAEKDNGGSAYRLGTPLTIAGVTESTATLYDISTSATNGTIAVTVGGESASSAEASATVTITATPSDGYSFSSWTVTKDAGGDVDVTSSTTSPTTFSMPGEDVTVSATFSEITHTVSVAAGAHGTVSPSSVSGVGIATASSEITATPSTGYSFNGWTLPSGVTAAATYSASSNPIRINATSDDLTITATWTTVSYTITYNLNSGSLDGLQKTSYNIETEDYDLPTPTYSGHVFQGWYTDDEFTSDRVYTLAQGSTGNKNYYAKWADGVNVVWTITKVDSKLYKGGTGYSVKAVVNNTSWTGHDNLVLSASDGVTLGTPTKSTVDSKAQIVADFSISGSLAEDAITFSLYAPATGVYAAIEDEKEVELDDCPSAGGSTTLFSQNFNDATAVAYTKSTARAYTTASPLSGLVGTGENLFTSITGCSGSGSGIAINSTTGREIDASGIFQVVKGNSDGYWSVMRTADFAATAPTLLSFSADIWFKNNSSGDKAPGVYFAIGDGFTDGLTSAIPATTTVHSGFCIHDNSTAKIGTYATPSTILYSTGITQSTWLSVLWVINNTGESQDYANPTGSGKTTLSNDQFDIWVKTQAGAISTYTKIVDGANATTALKDLQEIYIGSNGGKQHEFRLENIVVKSLPTDGSDGVATSLAWSDDDATAGTVNKNDNDGDFRIYASPTPANAGGTITYSSSNTSVATVSSDGTVHIINNGTTYITASMSAYGCYSPAEPITYSLVVANTCDDTPGTIVNNDGSAIAGDAVNRGACETLILRLTGHSGSTIQWKKDGADIDGATEATYSVPRGESGVYTAVVRGGCDLEATNSITVTTAGGTPNPTIYANDFYVKSDKWFGYRLMKINEGETVSVKTNPDGWEENTDFFITTDASGIVSISGRKNISTPSNKTLTLTIANECGGSVDKNITIREMAATSQPTIAWIATNNDGGSGQKDNVKADESTNTGLYDYLKDDYIITPRNCYWTTIEADLVKEYSQFDLIILTDYPNSGTCPSGKSGKSNSYTNAIGLLIDHKPIMTFEAFVAGCPNWGIASNPQNTQTTQTDMTLLCNANDIFGTSGKFAAGQAITVTSASSGQALQGFPVASSPDFVFIGKITDSDEKTYVACCERQHEIAARMMVFGLNSSIMSSLTDDGKTMVKGFIDYLLKDDPASVPDCSVIFNGGGVDDSWYTTANWEAGSLPDQYASVRIDAPCVVPANADPAKAGRIKIHQGGAFTGSLTIQPRGRMIVEKTITRIEGDEYTVYKPTEVSDLVLETSEDGNGVLIMGSYDGTNKATVGFYTKAKKTGGHNVNQFIGTPFNDETYVFNNYYGTKIYEFRAAHDGDKGTDNEWIRLPNDGDMRPFYGYNILTNQADERTLWMEGTLVASEDQKMKMYYNGSSNTENMFANSWPAPIDIAQFTASDFGGGVATVYIFNAGTVEDYTEMASGSASATSAGQFIVLPIASAPWTSPTVRVIPSMQAFSVFASGSNQTMTLDYDRLVRTRAASMDKDSLTTATRAPRRAAEEPVVMHLRVDGINGYAANMHVLEREDLTDGFDNGWDGHHMVGDEDAPQLYAITEAGKMNVNCVPNMEGTVLGFRAGTDNQFTFSFGYEGEEDWYLNDLKEQKSTLIDDMSSYTFMVEPEDAEARFVISKTPIRQTPTGCESVGAEAAKVRKVIIDDKVYIIRGGRMYSVDGQMVK